MVVVQRVLVHVRKLSQLNSALGVNHIKSGGQNYQIIQVATDEDVVTEKNKRMELNEGRQEEHKLTFSPLPAKRWEHGVRVKTGVSISVDEK